MKTLLTILGLLVLAAGAMFSTRMLQRSTHAQDQPSPQLTISPTHARNELMPVSKPLTRVQSPPSPTVLPAQKHPVNSPQPVPIATFPSKPAQTFQESATSFRAPAPNQSIAANPPRPLAVNSPKPQLGKSQSLGQPHSRNRQPVFGTAPSQNSSFGTVASTKPTQPLTSWPPNAINVTRLVRTQYSLPAGAADSIVEFFSADDNETIETKIKPVPESGLVSLQVTTDEQTQRAIATFLAAVYPQKRLDSIKSDTTNQGIDKASQPSTETPVSQTVPSLRSKPTELKETKQEEPSELDETVEKLRQSPLLIN